MEEPTVRNALTVATQPPSQPPSSTAWALIHTKQTYKFQGRYFRPTGVAGNVEDEVLV
jgi:hypothetical protein